MSSYGDGWNDGYNAAIDDIKTIGEALIDSSYSDDADLLVEFLDRLLTNG